MGKRATRKTEPINNRSSWLIRIVVVLIFIGFISAMCYFEKTKPEPEDYFIKYDDATILVEVEYGKCSSMFGYKKASGFISSDVYDKYKNNEYDEAIITVYHPYLRGESIIINTDSVVTITVKTYENFYGNHSPDIYKK